MTGPPESRKRRSAARERLLGAAFEMLSAQGVGDASLRELATALGTSHRMLIYHFGSREGLLTAVVGHVEELQRVALAELAGGHDGNGGRLEDVARAFWLRLTDPALAPAERLFFEIYAQALQGRPWAVGMLPGVVEAWLPPLTELFEADGLPHARAAAHARLALATARGLLLDLLATGDRDAVQAAYEEFSHLLAAPVGTAGPEPRSDA